LGMYRPRCGAVTTGVQWVGFLHGLLPSSVAFENGQAVVFQSAEDIEQNFELFYNCFSLEGCMSRQIERYLAPDRARGLIDGAAAQRVVAADEENPLSYQQQSNPFYQDLQEAMKAAFSAIQTDQEAINACFVESRQSRRMPRVGWNAWQPSWAKP